MSATPPPLPCQWDGEAFRPAGTHWARTADKHFTVGQVYPLEVREDRSSLSHRHFFASVNEAWQNLPEDQAERFPSSEHLRKFCLIKAGYCDQQQHACSSKAEAIRFAAFVRPLDDYALVTVTGPVVTVFRARSQSVRAMPKGEFQRSKEDVLNELAKILGTTADDLAQAGEAA